MRHNLCGEKDCCPVVLTKKDRVEIGEKGNLVKLKKTEWNNLVEGVRSGKLKKI